MEQCVRCEQKRRKSRLKSPSSGCQPQRDSAARSHRHWCALQRHNDDTEWCVVQTFLRGARPEEQYAARTRFRRAIRKVVGMKHLSLALVAASLLSGCCMFFPCHPGLWAYGTVTQVGRERPSSALASRYSVLRSERALADASSSNSPMACRSSSRSRTQVTSPWFRPHQGDTSVSQSLWLLMDPRESARYPGQSRKSRPSSRLLPAIDGKRRWSASSGSS